MTGNMRQLDVGVVSHPAMPVAAADTAGFYGDNDAIVRRRGIGDDLDVEGLLELFIDGGSHVLPPIIACDHSALLTADDADHADQHMITFLE